MLAGSTRLQQEVINSAVVPLLPALLHHQSTSVRLAAAWLATNLAYRDEEVVPSEGNTQVRLQNQSAALVILHDSAIRAFCTTSID